MNRLPGYDTNGSRAERLAFISLNLVAIALIAIVAYDASRSAQMREEITTEFPISATSLGGSDTNSVAKKGMPLGPEKPKESAGVNRVLVPKS